MSGPNGDLGTPVEAGAEGEEDGFGEAGDSGWGRLGWAGLGGAAEATFGFSGMSSWEGESGPARNCSALPSPAPGRVRSCRRFPEIPGEHLRAGLWKPQPWRTVVSRACFTDEETEAASGITRFWRGGWGGGGWIKTCFSHLFQPLWRWGLLRGRSWAWTPLG